MIKKIDSLFLLVLLPVSLISAKDSIVKDMKNALDEIGKNHYEVLRVGFGNFTYEYSSMGGSFSRFIEEQLKKAIAQSDYYELFVQDALENLDPSFNEVYGDFFSAESLEALLRGKYFDEENRIRLSMEVISFKTGLMVGETEVEINIKDIPHDLDLIPPDYEEAINRDKEFEKVFEASDESLIVHATTNRGAGAVFHDGEEMVIFFFANKDAYIKVYHIDVHGKMKLIFPNQYYFDNFVQSQTLTRIPGKEHPFTFLLGKPYGTEFIKVMASTSQFQDIEESFTSLGKASRGLLTRGLTVKQMQGDIAETLIKYTIVE